MRLPLSELRNVTKARPAAYSGVKQPILFKCPKTGMNVQHEVDGSPAAAGDARVRLVSCLPPAPSRQRDDRQAARRPERPAGACEGRRLLDAEGRRESAPDSDGVPRPIVR